MVFLRGHQLCKVIVWSTLCTLGTVLILFKHGQQTHETTKIDMNAPNNSWSLEQKVAYYREMKKMKSLQTELNGLMEQSDNKMNTYTNVLGHTRSVLTNEISVAHPMWLDISNMETFFSEFEILALGKKRNKKAFAVFGIPTVKRKNAYYVIETIKSLLKQLTIEEKEEVVIVLYVADFSRTFREKVLADVRGNFHSEVNSGLIQVIVPNKKFYPNLNKIPHLYGDKTSRVKWRSKQCLDYAFLYYYCAHLAKYYVQLEDDVIAQPGFLMKMKSFIAAKGKKWSLLQFGARGFIGMLYRTADLKHLSKFIRSFFWTMPVDWLFPVFNNIYLYGNSKAAIYHSPLFLHVGAVSSLTGQTRDLEDLKFIPNVSREFQTKEGNPQATVTTTIEECVDSYDILQPYIHDGSYFWGMTVKRDDIIDIVFKEKQTLKEIVFVSGSQINKHDVFGETELLVSLTASADGTCGTFKSLRTYDKSIVRYTFTAAESAKCIRLVILSTKTDSNGNARWLIISEIAAIT